MAAPKRPLDPDYLFNILVLNKWFAISSVFLLVGMFAMVKHDYDREWKVWQRKFRTLEREKTAALVTQTSAELAQNAEYQAAKAAQDAARAEQVKNERQTYDLNKKIEKLRGEKYALNLLYQQYKAELDAYRYQFEEAMGHHPPHVKDARKRYQKKQAQVNTEKKAIDEKDAEISALTTQSDALRKDFTDAEERMKKLTTSLERLERKAEKIQKSFVNDIFRDAPMLDFINPSLRVKEVIVQNVRDDYNFTDIPRIDACATCHVAIDQPGYEDQPNPLKTHPRLELFLSGNSPHDLKKVGCTTCHLGLGGGLTFVSSAHTPRNPEQGRDWEKKYGWHSILESWDDPMLPLPYTEATCLGCHRNDVEIFKTQRLEEGIQLVERAGCYGCHKIEGWENVQKAGPSLRRIGAKVEKEWILKWLKKPTDFRPTSGMPQFFGLENTGDPRSQRRNAAEIAGIAAYLLAKSEPFSLDAAPAAGSVERGKSLFGEVGCLGCHTMDDYPLASRTKPVAIAPDLSPTGSKLSASWLGTWLRNPKHYWPGTRMPSLRLSAAEISDLTAYLLSKHNVEFEKLEAPKVNRASLIDVGLSHLRGRMDPNEARKKITGMKDDELLLYVGERSIFHYGCFGCHDIPGFEDAKPIGTELTQEASKPLSRFDFGFIPAEKTVSAWIRQKILNPRIWDKDKVKEPLEKLKMPNFHFSEEEADKLLTFLLGLRKYTIRPEALPAETPHRAAVREGRRLVHRLNCKGCHLLEGTRGDILGYYEDPSLGPPNLYGEGKKIQAPWLFNFLKGPTPIRPWLKVRMPTFGFDDDQANTLVRFFRGLDQVPLGIEPPPVLQADAAHKAMGQQVFTELKCAKCHLLGAKPAPDQDLSNAAPSFSLAKNRLRHEWIADWLWDPQKQLPGTRMPNFFQSDGQMFYPDAKERIDAVRDHLFTLP